ncbi:MAG: hypothetical protein WCP46_00345 [Alphaproteobacteria bacterium]
MVTLEKFIGLTERRISLDAIYILQLIAGAEMDEEIALIPKIGALIQLLTRKGLITDKMQLTVDGIDMLNNLSTPSTELKLRKEVATPNFPTILHTKLQDILEKNTKKRQAIMRIKSSKYYFLCGVKDLEVYLKRFNQVYPELWNEDRITKVLCKFVDECSKKEVYTMLVQYFILHKERGSALATALENFDEADEKEESLVPLETKDLFG